jgi:hypothetical protein
MSSLRVDTRPNDRYRLFESFPDMLGGIYSQQKDDYSVRFECRRCSSTGYTPGGDKCSCLIGERIQ